MKKIIIFFTAFIFTSSLAIAYGEYGINGGHCRDLQYGKRVKSEGGRPGTIIDCRIQDNIINEEAYATVKYDDDPDHPKEIHWSRLRLLEYKT